MTDFQSALRIDTADAMTWALLGEAYIEEGKYTASMKALDRSLELDNGLRISKYHKAVVHFKLGQFEESADTYRKVLSKNAIDLGQVPFAKGLAQTLIAYARESYFEGAYGRCFESLMESVNLLSSCLSTSVFYNSMLKLLGDSCMFIHRLVPHLMTEAHQEVFRSTCASITQIYESQAGWIEDSFENSPIGCVLRCASLSYQASIVEVKKLDESGALSSCYTDLATSYYARASKDNNHLYLALQIVQLALQISPDDSESWNALAIFSLEANPKLCQHAFIKSCEYSPVIVSNVDGHVMDKSWILLHVAWRNRFGRSVF